MTCIIIHFLESKFDLSFDDPLEHFVKETLRFDHLLTLDNFSDMVSVNAVLELVKQSGNVVLLCDFKSEKVSLGAGLQILNAAVKQPSARLFANQMLPGIKPVFQRLKGKVYTDVNELSALLND